MGIKDSDFILFQAYRKQFGSMNIHLPADLPAIKEALRTGVDDPRLSERRIADNRNYITGEALATAIVFLGALPDGERPDDDIKEMVALLEECERVDPLSVHLEVAEDRFDLIFADTQVAKGGAADPEHGGSLH